jgi:hypothetical protein
MFIQSITTGDRADAHRQALRRLGVKSEHVYHQASPAGDVISRRMRTAGSDKPEVAD